MFITLEGIEGSGKTSQMAHIEDFLTEKGHECLMTREPGGTGIGKKIRAILLDPDNRGIVPYTELLLYMADRSQHVHATIIPALEAGKTVVCDRFMDATLVYQGYARGLDIDLIHWIHQMTLGGLKPDVTFLLDLPVETGLARAWDQIKSGERSGRETRFEKESVAFHQKIRAGYLEQARLEKERYRVVEAGRSTQHVRDDIVRLLSDMIT